MGTSANNGCSKTIEFNCVIGVRWFGPPLSMNLVVKDCKSKSSSSPQRGYTRCLVSTGQGTKYPPPAERGRQVVRWLLMRNGITPVKKDSWPKVRGVIKNP